MIIELGGIVNNEFKRYVYIKPKQYKRKKNFIESCKHIDVYQCTYEYQTDNPKDIETCKIYSPLYFDLDYDFTEDTYKTIKEQTIRLILMLQSVFFINKEDIHIYFSGHKGFHVIVDPISIGLIPLTQLNVIYKKIAIHFSKEYSISCIDTKIYDRKRLIRIPNTINSKSGLYKVPIPLSLLYKFNYKDILEYASSPKIDKQHKHVINNQSAYRFLLVCKQILDILKEKNDHHNVHHANIQIGVKQMAPCIKDLLCGGIIKGNRNISASILANALYQIDHTTEEIKEIMNEWNNSNDPPLSRRELYTTIQSAHNMFLSGKKYGCTSIQDLGLCNPTKCKIH